MDYSWGGKIQTQKSRRHANRDVLPFLQIVYQHGSLQPEFEM